MNFHEQHIYKVDLAEKKARGSDLKIGEYIKSGHVVMASAAGWYVGEMCSP